MNILNLQLLNMNITIENTEKNSMTSHQLELIFKERGHFLYALTLTIKPRLIVEFGTAYGFSTVCFAKALSDLSNFNCNTDDSKIFTIDNGSWGYSRELLKKNIAINNLDKFIESYSGDSVEKFGEIFTTSNLKKIDLVHIDSNHDYMTPLQEFEATINHLSDDAYIFFHDTDVLDVAKAVDDIILKYPFFERMSFPMWSEMTVLKKNKLTKIDCCSSAVIKNDLKLEWTKSVYKEFLPTIKRNNPQNIIELGSIDLSESATKENLNKFFDYFSLEAAKDCEFTEGEFVSMALFWKRLGVDYRCIDTEGRYDSLLLDLNHNLKDYYNFYKKFDLVTNFGTTEHVFNQLSCFENIHNLCNTNGLILLSLPLQGWMDHGFYNYHPNFFYALAQANFYKIEKIKYAYWSGTNMCLLDKLDYKLIRNFKKEAISVVALYRKMFDTDFSLPFQEMYQQEVKNNDFKVEMATKLFLHDLIQQGYAKKELPVEVAVFGTGEAGLMALKCAKNIGARVVCIVDDFKSGIFDGIKIVDRNSFFDNYSKECPIIFYGKHQKNSPTSKDDVLAIEINDSLVTLSSRVLHNSRS